MKPRFRFIVLSCHLQLATLSAQPILPGDRVYTADQISNTVSVIDPLNNSLLGVIRLGDPVPASLSPLYKGQLLVHGLGFSPDHRTLAVVSIGSNSVTLIDTQTNRVKGTIYVGRSPHEAFFTPDGKQLWIAIRGEDYISVVDPIQMKEIRRIQTANGPSMVLFRPDGRYAFVPSSFTPELSVIDTKTYRVVKRVPQASSFSPNLAVSANGSEVWFTLKDTGKTQILSGLPPFNVINTLESGPISNHVALVDNARGRFAYVTVGGLNQVKVYRRGLQPQLVATVPTGDLPHGVWASGDGSRVYVGLENGDAVQVIDTGSNQIVATIPVGQLPQALVYVPGAVRSGLGTENLLPLGEAAHATHITLVPPRGAAPGARASVVVNGLGVIDHLQIAASGLEPGADYELYLAGSADGSGSTRILLTKFKANPSGSAIAQTLGPIRTWTPPQKEVPDRSGRRFLVVSLAGQPNNPILIEESRRP